MYNTRKPTSSIQKPYFLRSIKSRPIRSKIGSNTNYGKKGMLGNLEDSRN